MSKSDADAGPLGAIAGGKHFGQIGDADGSRAQNAEAGQDAEQRECLDIIGEAGQDGGDGEQRTAAHEGLAAAYLVGNKPRHDAAELPA